MKRPAKFLSVLVLIFLVFRPGFGTVLTWFDVSRAGTKYGLIYSGIRFDLRGLFDPSAMDQFKPIWLIDIPASLFSDTVALPVTTLVEYCRSRRTDRRLYGKWIPDRDRSMQEYHRTFDRYRYSDEVLQKHTSGFGKRIVTFSRTAMVIELEGERQSYSYRVVQAVTNRVVLRWNPSRNRFPNEFIDIEFDQDGFWYWPQGVGFKEYFRKQK